MIFSMAHMGSHQLAEIWRSIFLEAGFLQAAGAITLNFEQLKIKDCFGLLDEILSLMEPTVAQTLLKQTNSIARRSTHLSEPACLELIFAILGNQLNICRMHISADELASQIQRFEKEPVSIPCFLSIEEYLNSMLKEEIKILPGGREWLIQIEKKKFSLFKSTRVFQEWVADKNLVLLYCGIHGRESFARIDRLDDREIASAIRHLMQKEQAISNLQNVDLSSLGITQLTPEILFCTDLQHLKLADNHLVMLPGSLAELKNLSALSLSSNEFRVLPRVVLSFTHLEVLILRDNQLHELPNDLSFLENLKLIDISNNPIYQFPPQLQLLTKLETIIAAPKQFIDIPADMAPKITMS